MIIQHCTIHHMNFKDKQKIVNTLSISSQNVLLHQIKAKSLYT